MTVPLSLLLSDIMLLFYLIIGILGSVFLKDVWIQTDRYHTEIAEDYWSREYLDYSDKPIPMGDMI